MECVNKNGEDERLALRDETALVETRERGHTLRFVGRLLGGERYLRFHCSQAQTGGDWQRCAHVNWFHPIER